MRVINKKVIIIPIFLLMIFVLLINFKIELKNKNSKLDEVKLVNSEVKNKGFAIMISDGSGNYTESSSNTWPSNMVYNEELSGCIDTKGNKIDNALSFDSENNMATLNTNTTAYCYLYFDNHSITLTVSTDGVNNTLPTYNHYKATLTCDNAVSNFNRKYQRIEISKMNKSFTNCNLNYTKDTTSYTLLSSVVQSNGTQISSTNNAGGTDVSYRYTGKTPSNYIWFNNEMWRIIGLIPTCTSSGCSTKDNLVKIIRMDSLGGYAYDAKEDYTGEWGSNTLYTLLNSYYYGKNNGINDSSCRGYYDSTYTTVKPNCDFSVKGISSDVNDYYGRMVKDVYWNTGASNIGTANEVYKRETANQTISGKIGLMNASDYGYAGLYYDTVMNTSKFGNYAESNWIYGQGYEWTIIYHPTISDSILAINAFGYVSTPGAMYHAYEVCPVLYLESDVYVINGDGTEANPYIIGM